MAIAAHLVVSRGDVLWRATLDGVLVRVPGADEVVKLAEEIASKGPYALELVKRLLIDGQDADHRTANRMEQHSFGLIFGTADSKEGIAAFLEKRKPKFERK